MENQSLFVEIAYQDQFNHTSQKATQTASTERGFTISQSETQQEKQLLSRWTQE